MEAWRFSGFDRDGIPKIDACDDPARFVGYVYPHVGCDHTLQHPIGRYRANVSYRRPTRGLHFGELNALFVGQENAVMKVEEEPWHTISLSPIEAKTLPATGGGFHNMRGRQPDYHRLCVRDRRIF